jgi:hypothetical protein
MDGHSQASSKLLDDPSNGNVALIREELRHGLALAQEARSAVEVALRTSPLFEDQPFGTDDSTPSGTGNEDDEDVEVAPAQDVNTLIRGNQLVASMATADSGVSTADIMRSSTAILCKMKQQ